MDIGGGGVFNIINDNGAFSGFSGPIISDIEEYPLVS
jgi:hypothetical protein